MPLEMLVAAEKLESLLPFSSKNRPNVEALELLESFLPPDDRARHLCESYNNDASYFFRPIKHEELVTELLPGLYPGAKLRQEARASRESASPEESDSDLDKVDINPSCIRQSSIHLSYVDCEFPVDDDSSLGEREENNISCKTFFRPSHGCDSQTQPTLAV